MLPPADLVNLIILKIFEIFRTIWNVMSSIPIRIGSVTSNVADFSLGILLVGALLSIFLSFVNLDNVRSSVSYAESSARRERNRKALLERLERNRKRNR